MTTRFTREVGAEDQGAVRELLERRGGLYETLLMRGAAEDMATFSGWWFGAFDGEGLRALACVEGRALMLFGDDRAALAALAPEMHRLSHRGLARTGTQRVLAEVGVLDAFEGFFERTRKRVARDVARRLVGATSAPEPLRGSFSLQVAGGEDMALVSAFTAERAVASLGMDPRTSDPVGHEARCRERIASGDVLIGRDRGRPVFLAELRGTVAGRALLDGLYIPAQRRKIVAAALVEATRVALGRGFEELLLFADADQAVVQKALPLTAFELRCDYRLLVLKS